MTLDSRDQLIRQERLEALDDVAGPRVGDFVMFPDGPLRRISHIWDDGVQTSDGGSWYLGHGYVSFSGSLFGVTAHNQLVRTRCFEPAPVWFFHHDYHTAHNAVHTTLPFRVYKATEEAPR